MQRMVAERPKLPLSLCSLSFVLKSKKQEPSLELWSTVPPLANPPLAADLIPEGSLCFPNFWAVQASTRESNLTPLLLFTHNTTFQKIQLGFQYPVILVSSLRNSSNLYFLNTKILQLPHKDNKRHTQLRELPNTCHLPKYNKSQATISYHAFHKGANDRYLSLVEATQRQIHGGCAGRI
jgi:hypothetical protein